MDKVYHGRFLTELHVSMLKEIITLVRDYLSETRNRKQKYISKRNMKSFSNETLNFPFRIFWASYVLDPARNFEVKEL